MKVWFITGCSKGGLGYYMTKAALDRGDSVVAASRHPETLQPLADKYGDRVRPCALDITSAEQDKKAVRQAMDWFGHLDVLVNNSGYAYRAALEEGEEDKIRQLYEVNLFAPMRLMQLVLPIMRRQKSGTIVNISSISAISSGLGSSFYASSKAALELLSDGLRKEAAPLGIRVMIVEPGGMRTHFRQNLKESGIRLNAYAETAWKARPENVPHMTPEIGDPEKAGKVIVQVASQKEVPLRLQIGSDSVAFVRQCYADRLAEVDKYEALSDSTDFSKE